MPYMTALLLLTACAPATRSPDGLCIALRPLIEAQAEALQAIGVPEATLVTGARVVAAVDAGCA